MSETTARISEAAGSPSRPSPGPLPRPSRAVRRPGPAFAPVAWARANLFSSWLSSAVTVLLLYFLAKWALGFVSWGIVHAVWSVPETAGGGGLDPTRCLEAKGTGACWAMIGDKYRFILFGRYPYDEQWRPAIVVALFLGLYAVSAMRRFWRKELLLIWVGDAGGDRRADVGRHLRAWNTCRRTAGAGCRSP